MFGIGLPELAVIAFFGVVLLGPDKLPGLAKQPAHGIKTAKRMGDSVRDDLRSSLGDDYADLELRDLNPRELSAARSRKRSPSATRRTRSTTRPSRRSSTRSSPPQHPMKGRPHDFHHDAPPDRRAGRHGACSSSRRPAPALRSLQAPELARGSGQALRIFKSETKGLMDDDKSDTKDTNAEPKHVAAPADVAVDPIIVETPRGQDASRG